MAIPPFVFHKLTYTVEACEPGHPDWDPFLGDGSTCKVGKEKQPPAFVLRGKLGSKYGLYPNRVSGWKEGDVVDLQARNMNPGQNYFAHPFGRAAFNLVDGVIKVVGGFRSRPTKRRRRVRRVMSGFILPRRTH
jgi:hypothetical protein